MSIPGLVTIWSPKATQTRFKPATVRPFSAPVPFCRTASLLHADCHREVRRRTRVVGAFPDGKSALMLVSARLRHIAGTKWGQRRYLDMNRLREAEKIEEAAA